ncbi:hypothetical protein EGW08_007999 [Elysia chlorotica]|uniref:Fibronectin type-III domain-containing protein n=1 Tax=Elysia chlorotica TaxID=188477 RepID=A0A433TRQ7_ELYCH|nr:hypothetical protein EGW08_007999 [Elysia chlorotica]
MDVPLPHAMTGDSYVYVGHTLEITCTLTGKWATWSQHDISFYHSQPLNFESDAADLGCLDAQTYVYGLNSAKLVVDNITLDYAGQYTCYVGKTKCSTENLVGLAYDVHIEYSPHNVTNLVCKVWDWTEGMTCTWEHPVNYVNWKDISITLNSAYKNSKAVVACPHLDSTSCEWRNTQEFSAAPQYWLEISVTNLRTNDVAQKIEEIETMKLVQPSPVSDLKIKPLPERVGWLKLTWSHNKPLRDIVFRVRHRARGEERFAPLENVTRNGITTVSTGGESTLSLETGVYRPMTTHEFALDCYPIGDYSGFWSESRTIEITTPQTAPLLGPQIREGSYESGPCRSNQRHVTVLWSDVKEGAQNGIITTVSIHSTKTGPHLWEGPIDRYAARIVLGCEKYSLHLFAHNEAGSSQMPSEILIPPAEATEVPVILQESFSVEMTREGNVTNEIQAVWQHSPAAEGSSPGSFTIFWCLRKWPSKQCKGPLSWQLVPSSSSFWPITANITDATDYLYGISVTDEDTQFSSEIFWTDCLYDKDASIVPAPSNVELEPDSEGIKVRWLPVPCSYNSLIKVNEYIVKWQKTDIAEEAKAHAVPRSTSFYKIEQLQAETPYLVTVQSKSFDQLGKEADWVKAIPLKKTSSKSYVGLAIGLAIVVLFIAVFSLVIYCYCKHKKADEKAQQIVELMGPSEVQVNTSVLPTEKSGRKNMSGGVTVDIASANLTSCSTDEEEPGTPVYDNSGANLIGSPCSRLHNVAQWLKFFKLKKNAVIESPGVTFSNLSMNDQAPLEESPTSDPGGVQAFHALDNLAQDQGALVQGLSINNGGTPQGSLLQGPNMHNGNISRGDLPQSPNMDNEETRSIAGEPHEVRQENSQGHSNSTAEPNVGLYSTVDNTMALSELAAPFQDVPDSGDQRGDSVTTYIQLDFECSNNHSDLQNGLLTRSRENLGLANNDILAMRVEQKSFQFNGDSNSSPWSDNKTDVKKSGAAVLGINTTVEGTGATSSHKGPESYVRQNDVKNQDFGDNSCFLDSFHYDDESFDASDQTMDLPGDCLERILSGQFEMEKAVPSQHQQLDNSTSAADQSSQAGTTVDCVALNHMASTSVSDPNSGKDDILNPLTNLPSSVLNHSLDICSTSPSVIGPALSVLVPGTSVDTNLISTSALTSHPPSDPPCVSDTRPPITDSPYLPNTNLHSMNPTHVTNTASTFDPSKLHSQGTDPPYFPNSASADNNPYDSKAAHDSYTPNNSGPIAIDPYVTNMSSTTDLLDDSNSQQPSRPLASALNDPPYIPHTSPTDSNSQQPSRPLASSLNDPPYIPHTSPPDSNSQQPSRPFASALNDPPYIPHTSPTDSNSQQPSRPFASPLNDPPYIPHTSPSVSYSQDLIRSVTSQLNDSPYVPNSS